MRQIILVLSIVALAACGQPSAPPAAPESDTAVSMPGPMSTGELGAVSNTAMSITGPLTVSATELTFGNGFAVRTEWIETVDASALIAEGGASFAETLPGQPNRRVEVRRVVGGAPARLCGGQTVTYAALLADDPMTGVGLIVFTGGDPPNLMAWDSAVCATYGYAVD